MGKTTTTTSRSSSAIFSNPSILATFSKPQIQVGGKLLYGTTVNESLDLDDGASYEYGYPISPTRSYLSVAVPYQLANSELKLVFGVGYQRNEGAKWEYERVYESFGDRVTSNGNGRTSGILNTLTPGIALNFQDNYFLGVTLSRTLGSIIYTSEEKGELGHIERDIEGEQSAQFLRLGVLAKVTPELSIGVMYRPEFDWESGETITKVYRDGELETDRYQTHDELTIPAMWGLGTEYALSPEFIVALELQSRPFSDLQWRDESSPVIDNGFNLAVGAEYLGTGFPLRFGAFRDVIPVVEENDPAPLSLIGLTAGIGSNGDKNFSWDVSAVFGTWERVINDDGEKYSENLIRAGASATYRFDTVLGTDFDSSASVGSE